MTTNRIGSIRRRIVRGTVAASLAPLVALGLIAVIAVSILVNAASEQIPESRRQLFDEAIGPRLGDTATQIAGRLDTFRDERVADVRDWASSPLLVDAARSGAAEAEQRGYPLRSIESVESDFPGDHVLRVLGAAPEVGAFLQSRRELSPLFAEIFFTDANGYNVAATNPTSDFVQSDEDWWLAAWAKGASVGEIEYDDSAATFSMDISVRIDDPDTGARLGVMKAVLSVGLVQSVADQYGNAESGLAVTIFTADGHIVAETASGHAVERIMQDGVLASDGAVSPAGAAALADIDAGRRTGFELVGDVAAAHATAGGGADQEWIVLVEQPASAALAPLGGLEDLGDMLTTSRRTLVLTLLLFTAAAIGLAVAVSRVLARRIVEPIVELRDGARDVATNRLPAIIAAAEERSGDAELPALPVLPVRAADEIGELTESFNALQDTAARLAAEQVRQRRRNVADTFVALGRRNQNLVAKQLELIDDLEQTETRPETLESLFLLDHLATRMRRNAESLLVLAGQPAPRRWDRPVAVRDVIEAAAVETEDDTRVTIGNLRDAALSGTHASDVTHLVAELLENAANFSPPGAPIEVSGRRDGASYVVSIVDHGVGMSAEELADANTKLADAQSFDRAPSAYLGFFVIGHLAARHGIGVELSEAPSGGVLARVRVPEALIESGVDRPIDQLPSASAPTPRRRARTRRPATPTVAAETAEPIEATVPAASVPAEADPLRVVPTGPSSGPSSTRGARPPASGSISRSRPS